MSPAIKDLISNRIEAATGCRMLLLAPGPRAEALLACLAGLSTTLDLCYLDSDPRKFQTLFPKVVAPLSKSARAIRGKAARLPFKRHSFHLAVSLESLFAIRPPFTVLAELHRVLVPDGHLILFEPASHGLFSSMRDKLVGPGKRIFPLDEMKDRLRRADFKVDRVEEGQASKAFPFPHYGILADKLEYSAEPAPVVITTRQLREQRQGRS